MGAISILKFDSFFELYFGAARALHTVAFSLFGATNFLRSRACRVNPKVIEIHERAGKRRSLNLLNHAPQISRRLQATSLRACQKSRPWQHAPVQVLRQLHRYTKLQPSIGSPRPPKREAEPATTSPGPAAQGVRRCRPQARKKIQKD